VDPARKASSLISKDINSGLLSCRVNVLNRTQFFESWTRWTQLGPVILAIGQLYLDLIPLKLSYVGGLIPCSNWMVTKVQNAVNHRQNSSELKGIESSINIYEYIPFQYLPCIVSAPSRL
jgi:hypothetical protein